MARRLKHLMLATAEDPFDKKSWSGTPYRLREALERRVEKVTVFRPSPPSRNLKDVALRMIFGGAKYPLWITQATFRNNARELEAAIAKEKPEAVLSLSTMCIAELEKPGRPMFMFTDAPYLAFHEAYAGTISVPRRLGWFGEREAQVARRLDGLFFSSEWAAREAVRFYGPLGLGGVAMETLTHTTPFGAVLVPSMSREMLLARVDARPKDRLELLFVGKDWERKGGALALEVARLLRTGGERVKLHIVGCTPELPADAAEYVELHGLLRQDVAEEWGRMLELFLDSHFLIVPTQAECFGIVFAEAHAFALPPISRAVQALPGVVKDGETGLLFDPAAGAGEYVERILRLRGEPGAYREMAVKARERFEGYLNWDWTAREMVRVMEEVVDRG